MGANPLPEGTNAIEIERRVRASTGDFFGGVYVGGALTMARLVLTVKATTGHPTEDVVEGRMYLNTFDNKVWIYAEGDWRTVMTYTP